MTKKFQTVVMDGERLTYTQLAEKMAARAGYRVECGTRRLPSWLTWQVIESDSVILFRIYGKIRFELSYKTDGLTSFKTITGVKKL